MQVQMISTFLVLAMMGLTMMGPRAFAGDQELGKKKFHTCEGCHAVEGYSNAYPSYHVPRIGAQHEEYVITALKAYRNQERKHGSMQSNATSLTDEDIEDIAVYVAKFKGLNNHLPVRGNPEAGREKAAVCAGCHGEDGNSEVGIYPRLAAQYESYLVKALSDYKSGARKNAMMAGFAAALSEQDIDDLAAFYASQKRGLTLPKDW